MPHYTPYTPKLPNPYPKKWKKVSNFKYIDALSLRRESVRLSFGQDREAEYIVQENFVCTCDVDGIPHSIYVPAGMLTDLTSVPRLGRIFVGRVGAHLEAAIVHDYLFIAWQDMLGRGARREDFKFANEVMLQAMRAAGVGWLKRNTIALAVSSPIAWSIYKSVNRNPRYVKYHAGQKPNAA